MNTEILSPLKVVARFTDGRMLKGTTRDFSAGKTDFHVIADDDARSRAVKVSLRDLKAVFFVKDLLGDKAHVETCAPDSSRNGQGRPIRIHYKDGEVAYGTTTGYAPDRPGFFYVPMDPECNNLRVFAVRSAVARVEFLQPGAHLIP